MAGITRALITGFDETLAGGTAFVSNESMHAIARHHPDCFIPFAGIDFMRGAESVRQLEYWVRERGLRSLSLRPVMIGLPAADRHYYPFYEKCVELGVPLSIHASANWTRSRPSDLGHPRHFDQVASGSQIDDLERGRYLATPGIAPLHLPPSASSPRLSSSDRT